jgi:hypothetical protein
MKITQTGQYRNRDGKVARILRIVDGRAYGTVPGWFERTWWYTSSGEHALCPGDDLMQRLGELSVESPDSGPSPAR